MKKMVLGLSLALVTLGLSMSPALAEANPLQAAPVLSVADQAFLASLAAPVAPRPAATRPAGQTKALCSATANCASGTVTCQGNNSTTSCTAVDRNCPEQGHVTCDGATTWCPTVACPGCEPDWCTYEGECASSCYPCNYTYSCNETFCTDRCRCHFSTCPV